MKKVLTLFLLFCFFTANADDAVNLFLDRVSSTKDLTIVSISGKMLKIAAASAKTKEEQKMADMIRNIESIRVVTGIKPTEENKKIIVDARKKSEEMMMVKENEQTISMYSTEKDGYISEFIMIVENKDDITMVSITGKLDLEKLSGLSSGLQIDGLEHLKEIKNEKKEKTAAPPKKKK